MRHGSFLWIAVAVVACSGAQPERSVPHLFRFDGRSVEGKFPSPQTLQRIDRDSRGERLYLFPLAGEGAPVVILRADGSSATKQLPGYVAYLGDDEQFVLWSTQQAPDEFRFAGGSIVKRREALQPDYSGHYFFNAAANDTYIARCAAPDVVLAKSDLNGRKLFRREGTLLLCGTVGVSRSWACDRFAEDGSSVKAAKRIELGLLPVLDLDPFSGRLLVSRVRDDPFVSEWFVLDPSAGTKEPAGPAADFGLFLARPIDGSR